jgi:hypothetical protein
MMIGPGGLLLVVSHLFPTLDPKPYFAVPSLSRFNQWVELQKKVK